LNVTSVVSTASCSVDLDELSDASLAEIAAAFQLAGDRVTVTRHLRNKMLASTYVELGAIFTTLQTIAAKHGDTDAVRITA
jgi:hypothetical protein